ncbi:RNA polymerase sigma factor [Paludisphaera mucosa]|uniref:RNA polymerase sigma factor n=1 Tax=Paludisphaera mucosa TaxID=3030827 RepID=A0ABT6FEF6_9BACT|nr:RNA polymerase sigma factor [Paludisphaera mucosa]MDG3005961.1 RNA polymerase sigma factor [Paludisphaera mucosa]
MVDVHEIDVASPGSSGSVLPPAARRMFDAIEGLPDDEREALDLVRIHGMSQVEAAELLGVSIKTVQRRLQRAVVLLTAELRDLGPDSPAELRALLKSVQRRWLNDPDLMGLRDGSPSEALTPQERREFQTLCEGLAQVIRDLGD